MVLGLLQSVGIVIFVFVTALFILSIFIKRNDVADVAWGTGILLVAIVSYLEQAEKTMLMTVLVALAALWGVRLTIRIFLRNRKKSEDYRYKKWRDEWGKTFYLRSYGQVYLLQGFLMIVVGYVFVHTSLFSVANEWVVLQWIGLAVWLIGYFFEVVGDWQLDRFLSSPREPNAVLQTGLWKYTRHPNYFGEITMWWGIWLMVLPIAYGYLAVISPLAITYLILKVSGIPMLEKKFDSNPVFVAYKKRTSALIPLPPRRS